MDNDEKKNIIETWKIVIDVQKHFNDIIMRIRSLFITIVLALAAAQGFLMEKGLSFTILDVKILYATLVPMLGIVGTILFYFMDRYWYHRLLVGSVQHGIKIENKYKDVLPDLGLSDTIGQASPIELKSRISRFLAFLVVRDKKYRDTRQLHSDGKIEIFYKSIALMFLLVLVFTSLFVGITLNETPLGLMLWKKAAAFCG